jgi:hypothetical protein
MINFKPFQNLYQHIKKSDPRLFETLDKISTYLQGIGSFADNLVVATTTTAIVATATAQIAYASGQGLSNVQTDIAGCTITLPKAGRYIILGYFTYQASSVGPSIFTGNILADGVALTGSSIISTNDNGFYYSGYLQGVYNPLVTGKIVKLQASNNLNLGAVPANDCSIIAIWLGM